MRSHVVFKLLNYVTDKIVRVALTTLALMLTCVETVCEGERSGEIEYVLSVHKAEICGKNMDMICRFFPFVYYIYLFGQCRCGFWFFCCFRL